MPYRDAETRRAYMAAYHAQYRADGRQAECTRRYRKTQKGKAVTAQHALTPIRKTSLNLASAKQRLLHPDRIKARAAVNHAIRDGKLVREPCEVCGSEPVEAHHDDYSKPLDVRWLCEQHHEDHHVTHRQAS